MRIFLGNFGFERELSGTFERGGTPQSRVGPSFRSDRSPKRAFLSRVVRDIPPELAAAWAAVSEADDLVLTSSPLDSAALAPLSAAGMPVPRFVTAAEAGAAGKDAQLVPWGWTDSMLSIAADRGWRCSAPPLDVVRLVNSRKFRLELETTLGVGLPGAAFAGSVEELRAIVASSGATAGWILKSNYGMAGRESVRGRGDDLPESLRNWARARIARTGGVVFEPLVHAVAEAGIQIEVPQYGPPEVIGVTPLLADRGGTYRGSRFGNHAADVAPWSEAVETALHVARRLAAKGYFGPLGIDAMWYRDEEGTPRLRPLQDLNARSTMGRLALGFRRILPTNWCATWLHLPQRMAGASSEPLTQGERAAGFTPAVRPPSATARLIVTSPRASRRPSILILAESPQRRAEVEETLGVVSLDKPPG